MTDEDKAKINKVWDDMSEEEKEAANAELHDIIQWWREEEHKAMNKIKEEGRHQGGMDGRYPELKEISKQAREKIRELGSKVFGVSE